MTVRAIFMALTIPLFLLMAAVNGAVLYFQEQSELTRALNEQTLAAAIVTAEFIAEMDDPHGELRKPQRQDAINAASNHIEGLQGLYLIEKSGSLTPLIARSIEWSPPIRWTGAKAQATVFHDETGNTGFFAAIHPAGPGRAVAARIDAAPLLANRAQITQIILSIILGVSIFSAALSWFVAHRVVRELRWNRRYLRASTAPEQTDGAAHLSIRETRDLSDAVGLMKASRDATEKRHSRDTERGNKTRDINSASRELHSEIFPDAIIDASKTTIAVRICGSVPPGSFYAVAGRESKDAETFVVIGRCRAVRSDADLANAAAARQFIEANLSTLGHERCLKLAKQAFDIETLDRISWASANAGDEDHTFLCDAKKRIAAGANQIVESSGSLAPDQILDAIESLLSPTGIFVVVGRRNANAE